MQPKKLNRIDNDIIFEKFTVNKLAVICGTVMSDISNTIPTSLMLRTIVTAIKSIIVYSIN